MSSMTGKTSIAALTLLIILIIAPMTSAEIPGKINYQGKLEDADTGEPLTGLQSMTFRLYDDPSAGSLLWTESGSVSADSAGIFSVIMGSITPIDVSFGGPVWLEVEIGGEVLAPRRELVSVPYAFYSERALLAESADMLDSLHADAFSDTAHRHDDRYFSMDSLSTTGTVNQATNPVDWSRLKNVPAGFADGTDNEAAGAGDGHSLDASDGSPADVVYVDQYGDVGIGTIEPEYNLHVYRDRNASVGIAIENPNTGASSAERLSFNDENGGVAGISMYDRTNAMYPSQMRIFNNRPDGSILLAAENIAVMTLKDGRVGIRESDPSQVLDVDGTASMTGFKMPTGAASGYVLTSGPTGTGSWQPAAVGDGHSLDAADGVPVDALYVSDGGLVGIGTTVPIDRLHLDGGNSEECFLRFTHDAVGATFNDGLTIGIDQVGDVRFWNREAGNMTFGTNAAPGITIDSDGRVGIGTGTPHQKLHLHKDGALESCYLQMTNSTIGSADTDGCKMGIDKNGSLYIMNQENGYLFLGSDNQIRLTVTPGGDFGLGTVAPQAHLHIHEAEVAQPNYMHFTVNASGPGMLDGMNIGIGSEGGANFWDYEDTDMRFATNGLERVRITNDGKIGIGEQDPAEMLDITGNDPYVALNTTNNKTGLKLQKNGTTEWEMAWNQGSGYLYFYNSGTRMVIEDATGDVGIGTSTPGYKLDVAGAAHASSFPTSSDARFKENVEQLTGVLDKLDRVRGVKFDWNSRYESLGRATGHREIGVIAQEIEEEFPELVTTWGDEDYRAVDYGRMAGVFIEAIKELRSENRALRQRIEALEAAVD